MKDKVKTKMCKRFTVCTFYFIILYLLHNKSQIEKLNLNGASPQMSNQGFSACKQKPHPLLSPAKKAGQAREEPLFNNLTKIQIVND
jgi:hypothetical protein